MSRTTTDAGGGDALSVTQSIILAAPFTFVAWAKSSDAVDDFQVVGGMSQSFPSGTDDFWKVRLRFTSGRTEFRVETTAPPAGGQANVTPAPAVDTWAHYAFVETASDDRAGFVDGANKDTNSITAVPSGIDTISLGQVDDGSPGDRFIGDIGHAALYNTPLSDQEVETLAAGFNPRRLHIDNLVGYWPVNGQTPEPNVIGTGANLGLVGTPAVAEEPPIANFMQAA